MVSLLFLYIISFLIVSSQLQNAANGTRNDDVAKTNVSITDYVIPMPWKYLRYDQDEYPMPTRNQSEERGWSHPEYAFDLQMGIMDISKSEWPSFLYPQGTSWDVEDDKTDLFRGYLLVTVSLIIIYMRIDQQVYYRFSVKFLLA